MKSRLRRTVLSLALLALIATGCSSSSDAPTEAATIGQDSAENAASDADGDDPPASDAASDAGGEDPADDAADSDATDSATSIPVPETDSAAADAIAGLGGQDAPTDPIDITQGFVRSRFNIDPPAEALQCIVDQSASDPVLDAALTNPTTARGEIAGDNDLKSLSIAVNGCVDTISLGDWATEAVGPQGEVRETAPGCFAERFDGPNGDQTFYTLVALNYQFRIEPAGVGELIDTFVDCTPISSLTEFFASQGESQTGFTTQVDRECLTAELDAPDVSRNFWTAFIEGLQPPASIIDPFVVTCSSAVEGGPSDPLPADFVAWSGDGALSSVLPSARAGIYDSPPPMTIDPTRNYEAVIATGGGEIRIRLFADTAPLTVNNFVNLARDGYYDGTIFHRVLDQFMAQGGDPTGTGTGGPGYQFADEFDGGPPLDRKGLLAMANAGPATNGSQFFITFVPTEWLTGNHTVFGEVTQGIDIVDAIELRDPGAPTGPGQVLTTVTIIEN